MIKHYSGMDRNNRNSVVRKHSDSTYFRQTSENRKFISNSNSVLVYQPQSHPDLNYGDIGATRILPRVSTCRMPDLFARRSVRRISAALAGLLACATAAPVAAVANTEVAADAGPEWMVETGSASWYAATRHASRTASGSRYDQNAMTAAHPWLPFGTQVRVTRQDTGHSVIVTINDRLPSKRHIIDLSVGAAKQLGMLRQGTTEVELAPAS